MKANYPSISKGFRPIVAAVLLMGVILALTASQTTLSQQAYYPDAPQPGPHYTVNDPSDPGGDICDTASCSLRAALNASNSDGLPGVHSIQFDLSYPVTITLNTALPVISETLSINGPGASELTLSGNGLYRALEVASEAALDLSGISIRQAYNDFDGAGILNHGVLTVTACILADNLSSNQGGGIRNDGGSIFITDSSFTNNHAFHHGAISNDGDLTIDSSTFTDNHARIAGAINNNGTLTVTNSTFTGNIAAPIEGGAIFNVGTLVLANSTFFQNGSSIGADISNHAGDIYITNSTFYSLTGNSTQGIANFGVSALISLTNTILAAGDGYDNCAIFSDAIFTVDPSNLATDNTCGSATQTTFAQLALGLLQNNGGQTPTIALLDGSIAINQANDAVCAAAIGGPGYGAGGRDQRGASRPQGEHCDVGAYELASDFRLYLPLILRAMLMP